MQDKKTYFYDFTLLNKATNKFKTVQLKNYGEMTKEQIKTEEISFNANGYRLVKVQINGYSF